MKLGKKFIYKGIFTTQDNDVIQIMAKDMEQSVIMIATWNLVSNTELSMYQMKNENANPEKFMLRGIQPLVENEEEKRDNFEIKKKGL